MLIHTILYVVSSLKQTGPVNQLQYIIQGLDTAVFKPVIVTLSPEPKNTRMHVFESMGIAVERLNLTRFRGVFGARPRLQRLISSYRPAVIHTQGIRADGLLASLPGENRICTIRNYPYYDYPMKYGKTMGAVMAFQHIRALKRIPHVVACSQTIAGIFRKQRGIALDTVQNGVDTGHYVPVPGTAKAKVRQRLGLPCDMPIFIVSGSLIKRKDPYTVIKAFMESGLSGKAHLLFIGGGVLMAECKSFARNQPGITFTGNVENVNDYLQCADYFISASLAEGLPNTVLEAMACGLPVLLSEIPSHSEVLKGMTQRRLMFPVRDAATLACHIRTIAGHDDAEYAAESRKMAEDAFSAENMSRSYQRHYMDIIDGR